MLERWSVTQMKSNFIGRLNTGEYFTSLDEAENIYKNLAEF